MAMTENANLDALHSALRSVKLLRSTIGDVFKCLADCSVIANSSANNNNNNNAPLNQSAANESESNVTTNLKDIQLTELQTLLSNINTRFRDLESACTLLSPPSVPVNINLGNSNLLGQDPNYDRTTLYSDMINSYRWSDKMFDYSSYAYSILQQNLLKRTNVPIMYKSRQQRRLTTTFHNISPQQIDPFISQLQRVFSELAIEVVRPFGNPTILKVTIQRTLKVAILLRGLIIEWVMVKAFSESFDEESVSGSNYDKRLRRNYETSSGLDNEKIDIWSESRYEVFRRVTEHANAAMLHYYSPTHFEVAVKSYLHWLQSYKNLFSQPCRKCNCRLQHNMPPTWRDMRTFDAYHEQCRP